MDELIRQIAERTGIGEDKARQAAETVVSFLRTKFPALGSHLDSLQAGTVSEKTGGMAEKVKESLGGILGKKTA
jgi:hypothetical protein